MTLPSSSPSPSAAQAEAERVAASAQAVLAVDAATHDEGPVPSPCISVCHMSNAPTPLCEGCFRTLAEIAGWSRMDNAAKRVVWTSIAHRIETHRIEEPPAP